MSLFQATLATGFILIVLGLPLVVINGVAQRAAVSFLRSQKAAAITMVLGASWFLMRHVVYLSEADFGDYKGFITIISLAILLFSFASLQAQTYCAGDQVSLDHQNIEHVVGAGHEDYIAGDTFRLSDWNGDLNGGNYHIIFIDMSASW